MPFNIGDLVTRNSYNNDTVFKIIDIDSGIAILKGINIRLFADSDINDLKKVEVNKDFNDDKVFLDRFQVNLNRNEFFYLPGKVVHIDSDISLSNDLANPYKIRKKAKKENNINHQKNKKMSKI